MTKKKTLTYCCTYMYQQREFSLISKCQNEQREQVSKLLIYISIHGYIIKYIYIYIHTYPKNITR